MKLKKTYFLNLENFFYLMKHDILILSLSIYYLLFAGIVNVKLDLAVTGIGL